MRIEVVSHDRHLAAGKEPHDGPTRGPDAKADGQLSFAGMSICKRLVRLSSEHPGYDRVSPIRHEVS